MEIINTFLLAFLKILVALEHVENVKILRRLSDRTISTKFGKLRGTYVEFSKSRLKPVERYLGIQYASVLNGNLRFMPPTSPEYWEGIKHSVKHGPACPQKLMTLKDMEKLFPLPLVNFHRRYIPFVQKQAEECLNLNIFVPAADSKDLYPVLVFIHGESYSSGTGNSYDGSILASYGKILVVTVNYRLGILGFMTTGDSTASGNYAILDIIASIHWIRENIKSFRGDPNKITLFGHGHGAALVNMLLVSPMTTGPLFRGVIMNSGTAFSTWATAYHPDRCLRQLAQHTKCPGIASSNYTILINCLKNMSLSKITNFQPRSPKYRSCIAPVVSKRSGLLPRNIKQLHETPDRSFSKRPVMLGVTKYDALAWVTKGDLFNKINETRLQRVMRTFVNNVFDYNRQRIYDELLYKYTDWGHVYERIANTGTVVNMVSDVLYVVPAVDMARHHSDFDTRKYRPNSGQTYFYAFGSTSLQDGPDLSLGSYHGEDLIFVFGEPLMPRKSSQSPSYSDKHVRTSKIVMTYWSNFVKSGNPNAPVIYNEVTKHGQYLVGIQWPLYTKHNGAYIHIDETPKVGYHYRNNKVAFWTRRARRRLKDDNVNGEDEKLTNWFNLSTFDDPKSLTNYDTIKTMLSTQKTTSQIVLSKSKRTFDLNSNSEASLTTMPSGEHHDLTKIIFNRNSSSFESRFPENSSIISLNITIAIGSSLLFLNLIAFLGIYYQKKKIKEYYRSKPRETNSNNIEIYPKITKESPERTTLIDRNSFDFTSIEKPFGKSQDLAINWTTDRYSYDYINSCTLPTNSTRKKEPREILSYVTTIR